MPKRVQSPSSINTYKQCPRKYFYRYILKLPTKPSIHLIRGNIVHTILEKFFQIDLDQFDEKDYEYGFRSYVLGLLAKLWKNANMEPLKMTKEELESYFIDSHQMLMNFVEQFSKKLEGKDLKKEFKRITPQVEEAIMNEELQVRGFIDAIHSDTDEIIIMDYKTSKKDDMTPEYRLQLGIYALLYKLKYGKVPHKVGINFLKFQEVMLDVDDTLLEEAEKEIRFVHKMTEKEKIEEYPQIQSPLCNWGKGECDFYCECCKGNK